MVKILENLLVGERILVYHDYAGIPPLVDHCCGLVRSEAARNIDGGSAMESFASDGSCSHPRYCCDNNSPFVVGVPNVGTERSAVILDGIYDCAFAGTTRPSEEHNQSVSCLVLETLEHPQLVTPPLHELSWVEIFW